jgi:predicted nucleotidyltransferase
LRTGRVIARQSCWKRWNKSDLNIWRGNMILNPDFKEFFQLLEEKKVRYMIIGGFAVAYHGYPRYTKVVDIWIMIESDNAEKMAAVLKDFGFESLGLEEKDFLTEDIIIQLGYAPNRIDLIMGLPEVIFEDAYTRRDEEKIDGVQLSFIGLEDLRAIKKASGRMQDLADLENFLSYRLDYNHPTRS